MKKAFCILFISVLITGCQLYKKQATLNSETDGPSKSRYLNSLLSENYYLILHHGEDTWHLKNLKRESTLVNWSAEIEAADTSYITLYQRTKDKNLATYQKYEKQYLQQAHLFLADSSMVFSGGKVNFPITSAKIELLQTKHLAGVFIALGIIISIPLALFAYIRGAT